MDRSDWFRNRILWRANKNHLLSKENTRLFEDLQPGIQEKMSHEVLWKGSPILVFMKPDMSCWTLVTTAEVISVHGGRPHRVTLDAINKSVSVKRLETGQETKKYSEFIIVKDLGVEIWAPAGPELFGLLNILLMFPLGNPTSQ